MQKSYAKWVDFLYGPFFKVIAFFYRTYSANRARVEALKGNKKISALLRLVALLVLAGWILTWYFASGENRNRLIDEVKQSIGGFDTKSNTTETNQNLD